MAYGENSERIRQRALQRYIDPAIHAGKIRVSVPVKELMSDLERDGFPANRPAQFCTSIVTKRFLKEHGLEIERVEAPAKGKSSRVVVHYLIGPQNTVANKKAQVPAEGNEERAKRLVGQLKGLLHREIKAMGGTEAFMRWVRSDDEDAA